MYMLEQVSLRVSHNNKGQIAELEHQIGALHRWLILLSLFKFY